MRAVLLRDNFDSVYASMFGVVEIGIPVSSGFSIIFTEESYVILCLWDYSAIRICPVCKAIAVVIETVGAVQLRFRDEGRHAR